MRRSSSVAGLFIELVYAFVYFAPAFGAAGAGHGTGIFFASMLPYAFGLLVFPISGFLLSDLRPFLSRVLLISLLAIHYTLVIKFVRLDWLRDFAYIEKVWNYSPLSIRMPTGFYLLGQVEIRAMFSLRLIMII